EFDLDLLRTRPGGQFGERPGRNDEKIRFIEGGNAAGMEKKALCLERIEFHVVKLKVVHVTAESESRSRVGADPEPGVFRVGGIGREAGRGIVFVDQNTVEVKAGAPGGVVSDAVDVPVADDDVVDPVFHDGAGRAGECDLATNREFQTGVL